MKMAKALVTAAGLAMMSGAALARPDVDTDDLLGAWDAVIEGPDGEATVRVVFAEDGTYLALAIMEGMDDPVPFWETGEWEMDGDELTFEAMASSEEMDDDTTTVITIEDVDGHTLDVSSDEDEMWNTLEFHRPGTELVGIWTAEVEEGTATFMMSECGGFAGGFGDDEHQEAFWGTWTQDGDEVTFSATDQGWELDGEPEFEDHVGVIEDMDDDAMTMMIDGLSEEAIEWERVAACPLVGEWVGEPDGSDVTVEINEDSTFTVTMEGEDGGEFSGIWTVVGQGMAFFAVIDGEMPPGGMHFVMTSPTTIMFGENAEDMHEFGRQ